MDAPRTFHLHMISDATGETLVAVAKAVRVQYSQARAVEHIHPLESGFMRKKSRLDRRPSLPREPVWRFYPRYWTEVAVKTFQWVGLYLRLRRKYLAIKHDPNRFAYTDLAMTPVREDEADTHELFQTDVAKAFVGHQQHVRKVQAGADAGVAV